MSLRRGASNQLAPRLYAAKLSPSRLTAAARRAIEEVTREATTHPHIDGIGPCLDGHLYNPDRGLGYISHSEVPNHQ